MPGVNQLPHFPKSDGQSDPPESQLRPNHIAVQGCIRWRENEAIKDRECAKSHQGHITSSWDGRV